MIFRFLNYLLHRGMNLRIKNAKVAKCEKCGASIQEWEKTRLFLLPIFHDDDYEIRENYYISHCQPIESPQEIPTGQRACKMTISGCSKCYQRYVQVEDFLKVRDIELLKVFVRYDYQSFCQFLQDSSWNQKSGFGKDSANKRQESMVETYFPD